MQTSTVQSSTDLLYLYIDKREQNIKEKLTNELKNGQHKNRFEFRFTIGTHDQAICDKFESHAPNISERIECLKLAHKMGYQTSVSMEPMCGAMCMSP